MEVCIDAVQLEFGKEKLSIASTVRWSEMRVLRIRNLSCREEGRKISRCIRRIKANH
jgi:hypothetical protein